MSAAYAYPFMAQPGWTHVHGVEMAEKLDWMPALTVSQLLTPYDAA